MHPLISVHVGPPKPVAHAQCADLERCDGSASQLQVPPFAQGGTRFQMHGSEDCALQNLPVQPAVHVHCTSVVFRKLGPGAEQLPRASGPHGRDLQAFQTVQYFPVHPDGHAQFDRSSDP